MADDDKDKGSSGAGGDSSGSDPGQSSSSSTQGNPPNDEEAWKRLRGVVHEEVSSTIDERLKNWQPQGSPQQGTTTTGQPASVPTVRTPAAPVTRSKMPTRKLGFLERLGLYGDPQEILKRSQRG